nr:hypothetical protein [Tanacetum cinerariifolium]
MDIENVRLVGLGTLNRVHVQKGVLQPPVIHQPPQETSAEILHDHENVINFVETFLRKFDHFSFLKTLKVLLLAWDRVSKIKNAIGNKQYKSEDVQELFRKLLNDVQNIHEELAEYINIPSWNCPVFSSHNDDDDNDDENYIIPITPEEPDNSISMGDEHLDTIPTMELDEVINSSVEDLVPISSESEDQFEEFSDSNDDSTSIDDNYFSIDNIDYVEASPPDSELVSLEEDSDSFLEKSDTSLSYSDNSLPEFETFSNHTEETNSSKPRVHISNVLTTHPTLMLDSNFIPSDNSLPESDIFYFNIEEKNSESTTIHVDISLPDLESFNFKREPKPDELTSIVDSRIHENDLSTTNVNLQPENDHSPLFAYVVWIFLSFLTYPMFPPYLLSFRNEDTIFDPGIANYHFHSLLPDVSHQCGTFIKFNVYPNYLN